MRIHLVTYATPRFRHRQLVLAASARINQVVDSVTSWTPQMLHKSDFEQLCKNIKLSERGSGYWAWKPFIIQKKIEDIPEGDVVFYCDVGRIFPYKRIEYRIDCYLDWMSHHNQDMMPGIHIPWKGPMAKWTKRDAFIAMGMDREEVYQAAPIQASFSIWRNTQKSRQIIHEWMNAASQRALISDDADVSKFPELPIYHDHRHDQSLLSLVCLKHDIKGINLGEEMPPLDTQNPSEIARSTFGVLPRKKNGASLSLDFICACMEKIETRMRKRIKFGESLADPDSALKHQMN